MDRPPLANPQWSGDKPDPSTSAAPWKVYNVGNNHPEDLLHVVALLEKEFGRMAEKQMLPMQPGDVPATYADVEDLSRDELDRRIDAAKAELDDAEHHEHKSKLEQFIMELSHLSGVVRKD
jgi:UDP-glucose 4-epimerase